MDTLRHDLRFALRQLARSPGFTVTALLTLALGIGANTAIFSVVKAVLLAPLPFREPERLARVSVDFSGNSSRDIGLSTALLVDLQQRKDLFDSVSGLFPIDANVTEVDQPERVQGLLVDIPYFDLLGVKPQVGRTFRAEDYTTGISEVALISDGFWRRRYGADPNAVGKRFRLDNDWYTVLGVLPAGFRNPGRGTRDEVEVFAPSGWTTAPFRGISRGGYPLSGAIVRLRSELSPQQAQRRLDAFAAELAQRFPDSYPKSAGFAFRLVPLKDDLVGDVRPALLVLLGSVGFVLLIACANVANLLLARGAARKRELAVRQALGAGRRRLIALLLTESVALSVLGGLLGLALSVWGMKGLVALSPRNLPRLHEVQLDAGVLAFTLGVSLLTGLLFGLAPALASSRPGLGEELKDAARGTSGAGRARLRRVLVVAQVALALVLLTGAALLLRSFRAVLGVSPGFEPQGVLTAGLWLPQPNAPETGPYFKHEARVATFTEMLRRLSALPGVTAAATTSLLPLSGVRGTGAFAIEGREGGDGAPPVAQIFQVSAGYFDVLRIPLREGRVFTDADDARAARSAVVNQAFARVNFPGQQTLGKRIRFGPLRNPGPWETIVGVVGDVKAEGLERDTRPQIYRPILQVSGLAQNLVLRTDGDPALLAHAVRETVRSVDKDLPLYGVRTMEEVVGAALAERRFAALLLAFFAGSALLLAAVGIYGVMATTVHQRTHEIGVRMALGASSRRIVRLVLEQGAAMVAAGVLLGLAGAAAVSRLLTPLLYRVTPGDPWSFAAVAALLAAVALLAALVPALRASRVPPLVALRVD